MGEHDEIGGVLPNGLLPNAGPLNRLFDSERWLKAEERTAELIACIQPSQPSEERRFAVADYVQRLITNCFPCQVFTFGSVPLKTYLPDGDIDLTAFSNNQNLKETWANDICDMLQEEGKNKNAEFYVKEVQYIQTEEVELIKCLVENIVVDISFNQLGGLNTLCFLEEVDQMINQNHLFKRSIILIKAWCYYESRMLDAHHGLISTYALETLVLYIFHVYNKPFAGPLEVLYLLLEFFSNFDWENFCVSLWGPVPISSLPNVTAEPPRRDNGELLLSQKFLKSCSSAYAVFPTGQDTQAQPFVSKFFNIIDPLRVNNNLGCSVSIGNIFRIRSAFTFGAKRLARLLDCPQEWIASEVNQFFLNTWNRHGSGLRPDAPLSENPQKDSSTNKKMVPAESSSSIYSKTKIISDDDSETTELPSNGSTNVIPFTFYATGSPVPFVTMPPLYNVAPEEGLDNMPETRQNFDLSDILHSDFSCHWNNLQYGRFCQNVQPQVYPTTPVMVPPNYLQNHIAWDGFGQPVGSNSNLVNQLMSYGRIVPVASSRPPNVYQRYVDDLPRYRSGTGTYLPNPDTQVQPFVSKFSNIIDPLCVDNILGCSVNTGNCSRIRSVFTFGAGRLARLLDFPQEKIAFEVDQFFLNTWDAHGSGLRPDAPLLNDNTAETRQIVPIVAPTISNSMGLSLSINPSRVEESNTVEPRMSEPDKSRLVIKYKYEKQTDFDPNLLEFGYKGPRNISRSCKFSCNFSISAFASVVYNLIVLYI